jgi:hypothetical protein
MHHVILVDSEPGSSALAGRYRGVATVDHRVERDGSTGTTTPACTSSSITSHPSYTRPPTTLKPRRPSRRRLNHGAGIKSETVHDVRLDIYDPSRSDPDWCVNLSSAGTQVRLSSYLWRLGTQRPRLPKARNMLHSSLVGPAAKRVGTEFGLAAAELRVELVASHLVGLAFARYQLYIEPLASTGISWLPGLDRLWSATSPIRIRSLRGGITRRVLRGLLASIRA